MHPDILKDFADALGMKPRSKPISLAKARKIVARMYKGKKVKPLAQRG